MGVRKVLVVLAAMTARQVFACNPDAPVPPIMEDHDYDRVAMEFFIENDFAKGVLYENLYCNYILNIIIINCDANVICR